MFVSALPNVVIDPSAAARRAFMRGEITTLIQTFPVEDKAQALLATMPSSEFHQRGQDFRRKNSFSAEACSLYDIGGEMGFGGDMIETNWQGYVGSDTTAYRGLARKISAAVATFYGRSAEAAELGKVAGGMATVFAPLAQRHGDEKLLQFFNVTYLFDATAGLGPILPEGARALKSMKKLPRAGYSLATADFALLAAPSLMLADSPGTHGWQAPAADYSRTRDGEYDDWCQRQHAKEYKAQQKLIEKYATLRLPTQPYVVFQHCTADGPKPVLLSEIPQTPSPARTGRSVTGSVKLCVMTR